MSLDTQANGFIINKDYDIFEGMTSISALIDSIEQKSNNRKIIEIMYDEDSASKKYRELKFLKSKANELHFRIIPAKRDFIDSVVSGKTHGGIIAKATKRQFVGICNRQLPKNGFFALIEGVEDPYNFGYSVRSLYAAGVDGLILAHRNWMEFSGTVAKSSAGTSELLDIYEDTPEDAVSYMKSCGYRIICAGIRDSVPLQDAFLDCPVLLVVGGEKRGISRKILDMSDQNVRIEYARKFKGSLPTVSAISIMAYEIAAKRQLNKV